VLLLLLVPAMVVHGNSMALFWLWLRLLLLLLRVFHQGSDAQTDGCQARQHT
jgi:hypothetical protein